MPLVYSLLPNKHKNTYVKLFETLKHLCVAEGFTLNPEKFVIDFELGIHSAVREVWNEETVKICGCRFHLGQSWWRKIQSLGLSQEYKSESEISKWMTHTFGLSFLNPEDVGDCIVEDFGADLVQDKKVIAFFDYLVDTYISESSTFPPEIWAQPVLFARTTNACESFHSHFNQQFYTPHPNIFVFTEQLKNVQIDTYIKINSSFTINKCTNLRYINRCERMTKLIEKYKNGTISRYEYVKNMSHFNKHF